MSKQGLRVFDSDMHVMEPAYLWPQYSEPAYKHVAPVGLMERPRVTADSANAGRGITPTTTPSGQGSRNSA